MTNPLTEWFNTNIKNDFLQLKDDLFFPRPGFELEITEEKLREIKSVYVNYEEHGGLMFAEISTNDSKSNVKILSVNEVENVYKVKPERPGRSRKNSYAPDREAYWKLILDNFSEKNSENILFPIHFHTHPTEDVNDYKQYVNSCFQLNTSDGDIVAANDRFIPFGDKYKLRYLNAIIVGHDDIYGMIIYSPGITPLNFMPYRRSKLMEMTTDGFTMLGKGIGSIFKTNDNDADQVGSIIGNATGVFFSLATIRRFNDEDLSILTHNLSGNEYYATLNDEGSTIIKIPEYTPTV